MTETSPAEAPAQSGPWRAEFGGLIHEDLDGFVFTVSPPSFADDVAKGLNVLATLASETSPPAFDEVVHRTRDGTSSSSEPVYRITKRGAFVETEPLRAAFDMADGSHDLYAHPAPVTVAIPDDGRPNGWTEALALSFIALKKLDPDIGLFIDAFNEGAWGEIENEWSEFSEFVAARAVKTMGKIG